MKVLVACEELQKISRQKERDPKNKKQNVFQV